MLTPEFRAVDPGLEWPSAVKWSLTLGSAVTARVIESVALGVWQGRCPFRLIVFLVAKRTAMPVADDTETLSATPWYSRFPPVLPSAPAWAWSSVRDLPMPEAHKSIRASVVVCVYTEKRLSQIRAALDSIARQTMPPWQVIVVVDHNPALYDRLAAEYPDHEVISNKFERVCRVPATRVSNRPLAMSSSSSTMTPGLSPSGWRRCWLHTTTSRSLAWAEWSFPTGARLAGPHGCLRSFSGLSAAATEDNPRSGLRFATQSERICHFADQPSIGPGFSILR